MSPRSCAAAQGLLQFTPLVTLTMPDPEGENWQSAVDEAHRKSLENLQTQVENGINSLEEQVRDQRSLIRLSARQAVEKFVEEVNQELLSTMMDVEKDAAMIRSNIMLKATILGADMCENATKRQKDLIQLLVAQCGKKQELTLKVCQRKALENTSKLMAEFDGITPRDVVNAKASEAAKNMAAETPSSSVAQYMNAGQVNWYNADATAVPSGQPFMSGTAAIAPRPPSYVPFPSTPAGSVAQTPGKSGGPLPPTQSYGTPSYTPAGSLAAGLTNRSMPAANTIGRSVNSPAHSFMTPASTVRNRENGGSIVAGAPGSSPGIPPCAPDVKTPVVTAGRAPHTGGMRSVSVHSEATRAGGVSSVRAQSLQPGAGASQKGLSSRRSRSKADKS